jgi:hypothetical protein
MAQTKQQPDVPQLLDEERQSLLDFVLYSQNFVREAKIDHVPASMRGILN